MHRQGLRPLTDLHEPVSQNRAKTDSRIIYTNEHMILHEDTRYDLPYSSEAFIGRPVD